MRRPSLTQTIAALWETNRIVCIIALALCTPIAIGGFAVGCFVMTGLYTGMFLGALDAFGVVEWSDTVFYAVNIPLSVVMAVVCLIFRDELST